MSEAYKFTPFTEETWDNFLKELESFPVQKTSIEPVFTSRAALEALDKAIKEVIKREKIVIKDNRSNMKKKKIELTRYIGTYIKKEKGVKYHITYSYNNVDGKIINEIEINRVKLGKNGKI